MDAYEAPLPERVWGGRPWLSACCGGCCLGYIVLLLILFFLARWLIGSGHLPTVEDIRAILSL